MPARSDYVPLKSISPLQKGRRRSEEHQFSSMASKSKRWPHMELNKQICAAANVSQDAILHLVQKNQASLNIVNISTALHRLARLRRGNDINAEGEPPAIDADSRFQALLVQVKEPDFFQGAGETRARCMSVIAWSCAQLRIYDEPLRKIISEHAEVCLHMFKPFELSNLLWAFVKMPHKAQHASLFKKAHTHICLNLEDYGSESLSLLAWIFTNAWTLKFIDHASCANLLHKATELFAKRLDVAPSGRKKRTDPVSISNLVWSLATTKVHMKAPVLETLGDAALYVLHDFKAHELSITLWAFARLAAGHNRLFGAAADLMCESSSLRSKMHSQGVANIIFAFAKHTRRVSPKNSVTTSLSAAMRALLPTCRRLFPGMKPQEFSSLLLAALQLRQLWGKGHAADELLLSAVQAINVHHDDKLLEKLSLNSVYNILRAFTSYVDGNMLSREPFKEFAQKLLSFSAKLSSDTHRLRSCVASTWGCEDDDWSFDGDACQTSTLTEEGSPDLDSCGVMPAQLQVDSCIQVLQACDSQEYDFDTIDVKDLSSVFAELPVEFQAKEPAYVELPQAASVPPTLDIIHELSCQQDGSLFIAFEVNTERSKDAYNVIVQIFQDNKLHDTFALVLDAGHSIQNTHVIEMRSLVTGAYEVHFTLRRLFGEVMGEKTIFSFDRLGKPVFVTSCLEVDSK
mmetsp:Transcript_114940/g.215116  ORF Transcript_114940/g.215116 Transcript_114940/m.215116 type:complete len:687 (-) Transcript_114940:2-2062(-)